MFQYAAWICVQYEWAKWMKGVCFFDLNRSVLEFYIKSGLIELTRIVVCKAETLRVPCPEAHLGEMIVHADFSIKKGLNWHP